MPSPSSRPLLQYVLDKRMRAGDRLDNVKRICSSEGYDGGIRSFLPNMWTGIDHKERAVAGGSVSMCM